MSDCIKFNKGRKSKELVCSKYQLVGNLENTRLITFVRFS